MKYYCTQNEKKKDHKYEVIDFSRKSCLCCQYLKKCAKKKKRNEEWERKKVNQIECLSVK